MGGHENRTVGDVVEAFARDIVRFGDELVRAVLEGDAFSSNVGVRNLPISPAPEQRTVSPAAIDGMWKMVLATPMGAQQFTGRLATNGNVLTGSLYSEMGQQDFTGTVVGNTLKWDLKVTKPVSLTLKYEVQIEGDKLLGKVKMGFFGTAKLTGERM
jgi:aerobic carbon-monoxide dehydrogenase large subunit